MDNGDFRLRHQLHARVFGGINYSDQWVSQQHHYDYDFGEADSKTSTINPTRSIAEALGTDPNGTTFSD